MYSRLPYSIKDLTNALYICSKFLLSRWCLSLHIARHRYRSKDHLDRLRTLITSILGPHAHNLRKQGVEGTAQNNKHTFGSVVDCTDRTMGSCWSKLIKVSDKVQSLVDGEVETPPIGTFQEIRGVLGHSLTWAPGIARIKDRQCTLTGVKGFSRSFDFSKAFYRSATA